MMKLRYEIWKSLLDILNKYKYVILRNYEQLPFFENDIDILVKSNQLKLILNDLLKKFKINDVVLIRMGSHACKSCYFYDLKNNEIYHIDFFSTLKWKQYNYLDVQNILETRHQFKDFYIPAPKYEFCEILLTRLIYQKTVKEKYLPRIKFLATNYRADIEVLLKEKFDLKFAQTILKCIDGNSIEFLNRQANYARRLIIQQNMLKPFMFLIDSFFYLIRLAKRILNPEGLFIVLIGPDGSGKSTISKELVKNLSGLYRYKYIFHWRPFFIKNFLKKKRTYSQRVVENPHALPVYNRMLSFIKLIYYVFDFIFGYLFYWLPLKIKSSLIIAERYYYDFLVDQARYRMELPNWIYQFFSLIIPKPDLIINLDTNADLLLRRKNELTRDEVFEQKQKIEKYFRSNKIYRNINNNLSIDITVCNLVRIVIDILQKRYEK